MDLIQTTLPQDPRLLISTACSSSIFSYTYPPTHHKQSSNYHDELAWAASWLYEATGDKKYLEIAEDMYGGCCGSSWSYSWDSKAPGVQVGLGVGG